MFSIRDRQLIFLVHTELKGGQCGGSETSQGRKLFPDDSRGGEEQALGLMWTLPSFLKIREAAESFVPSSGKI